MHSDRSSAARWSGYVYKLRKAGIVIETIRTLAPASARYVLRSLITMLEEKGGKS